ncbi:zinc metalloproteinase nas-4-like [Oratosquilla oratoria]|uniref:zinc metalloproteinase nas-4-like n=1 Tax=Oratosquilla oratoria TaxID=337810 RepID=UPI003F7621F8
MQEFSKCLLVAAVSASFWASSARPCYLRLKEETRSARISDFRWPGNTVVYQIDEAFGQEEQNSIASAMNYISENTCIQFEPKSNETDYVDIIRDNNNSDQCYSDIGRLGGRQEASLSKECLKFGVIVHELLHVIGLFHEHTRPDRNDYVTILWENIHTDHLHNFQQHSSDDLVVEAEKKCGYDYYSIVHYSPFTWAALPSKSTIWPKATVNTSLMGQREYMTQSDICKLNTLYSCSVYDESTISWWYS